MTSSVVVPDTSVLLKWVLASDDEEHRERALEIREAWLAGRCAIVLPSLWFFEVGNILGMKQPDLAPEIMQILVAYAFEEEPHADVYIKALELMKKFRVTFYDAAYHVTAMNHRGTMVTADDAYYRRTSRAGHVQTLSNWSPATLI